MTHFVHVATKDETNQLITQLKPYQVERKGPGIVFAAKKDHISITVYRSGKILFQGKNAAQVGSQYFHSKPTETKISHSKGDPLPPTISTMSVLGSDETGTGDYFGPITVAACFVKEDQIEFLRTLGVRDSKQLSDEQMIKLAPSIQRVTTYDVQILDNETYNTWQQEPMSQGKMKAILHNRALRNVCEQLQTTPFILIDQFAQRSTYFNYLKDMPDVVRNNVHFATQAESVHLAVAAASILARVAFVQEMERLSETIGVTLPKGASRKVDEVAAQILKRKGTSSLRSISKWHFANTQKAMKLAHYF